MKLTLYQVDAFAEQVFKGNPAAVCPLSEWLPDEILQKIALENNLSETAFYVIQNNQVEIRWFTPNTEVDLCGHATLATAFVLKKLENFEGSRIPFYSQKSGFLPVTFSGENILMNFPVDEIKEVELTKELIQSTNYMPKLAFKGKSDYLLIFENEEVISAIQPNLGNIEKLGSRGLIVSAKGNTCDFVSRFFGPNCGVNEDPVTGSAHTTLVPYWSNVYGKSDFIAKQLSERGGNLQCKLEGNRVEISGKAILFMKGEIYI